MKISCTRSFRATVTLRLPDGDATSSHSFTALFRALTGMDVDLASDREMLSDLALNRYVKGQSVEILDEMNVRWLPKFSVTFKKEDAVQEELASKKPVEALEPDFAA